MRLSKFRVQNYRNILNSDWITISDATAFVGQNEAGKSNLFEALNCLNPFVPASYDATEDWPMDKWGEHRDAKGKRVCEAIFNLNAHEIADLFEFAKPIADAAAEDGEQGERVPLPFPVRLHRRSTGFRWYVSFAWKFTHASKGEFQNCILLLEEPGIHLHYSGQRDLLGVFESLSETNTILYTTHLSSMVDQANPERVRIVESRDNHLAITHGVVSSQAAPMAVIETALGLTPDLSGMLGNRKVLIVEGGTDALILHKLSGVSDAQWKSSNYPNDCERFSGAP